MSNPAKVRFLKRYSDDDAELMSKATILGSLKATRSLACACIYHEGERVFLVSGIDQIDDWPDLFELEPLITPGLFQVFWHSTQIAPAANDPEIREVIDDQHAGYAEFEGVDIADILSLYPPITALRIDTNAETYPVEKLLGYLILRNYEYTPLEITSDLRSKFADLFDSGSEALPYNILLQALMSFSWGAAYLQVYRCIENLFSLGPVIGLKSAIRFTGSSKSLAAALENELSWRPREQDALHSLLSCCSRSKLENFLRAIAVDLSDNPQKQCADRIYRYRNAQAHFRLGAQEISHTDEDWVSVISSLLEIVENIYSQHGPSLLSD